MSDNVNWKRRAINHAGEVIELQGRIQGLKEALFLAYKQIDGDYGNGIENGYFPDVACTHARIEKELFE